MPQHTLAIECASEACSVALFEGDTLVAGEYTHLGRGHAEALVPLIAALPGKGGADRILVSLGPGSFTGVRIGIAAARALALAWEAEVLGYPTLALVAAMTRQEGAREDTQQPVLVAMTGGHGEWFVQGFGADGMARTALASLAPAAAAEVAAQWPCIAGSQADALAALVPGAAPAPLWPDARQVMRLPPALHTADLAPLYGRAPDARVAPASLPPTRLPDVA